MLCSSRIVNIDGRPKCICRACTDPPRRGENEPVPDERELLQVLEGRSLSIWTAV